jgi:hypothetical protein
MVFFFFPHIAHHTAHLHTAHLHTAHLHTAHHAVHAAAATQVATSLITNVAVGTILYAICRRLQRLVEAEILSQEQAEAFKSRAGSADEKTRREMLSDANKFCEKYGIYV